MRTWWTSADCVLRHAVRWNLKAGGGLYLGGWFLRVSLQRLRPRESAFGQPGGFPRVQCADVGGLSPAPKTLCEHDLRRFDEVARPESCVRVQVPSCCARAFWCTPSSPPVWLGPLTRGH